MNKLHPVLQSSADPAKVSNTVRGAILMASSLIIAAAAIAGLPLTETEVAEAATQIGLAAGALWTLYGFILKALMWWSRRVNR